MRVAIIAEYYPRKHDPVLGVWAHRQAMAARDAGADVEVIVLHRPIPSKTALRSRKLQEIIKPLQHPLRRVLDDIPINYVPFLAPPRPQSYGSWSKWIVPTLAVSLRRLRRRFPFDLVHAHYAAPAGDAVRRVCPNTPLVISIHGGDVLSVARKSTAGKVAVSAALNHAKLVLANSSAIATVCEELGARSTQVVHLGTDIPSIGLPGDLRAPFGAATGGQRNGGRTTRSTSNPITLVTLGHVIARKRHADVLEALWLLRDSHPDLHWKIIGDGPELNPLKARAEELGLAERIEFCGQLTPDEAVEQARRCSIFVLPSVDEAFGVAYIEAMAGGLPAIGCSSEPGPEEIAQYGPGMRLVPPHDPQSLAQELALLVDNPALREKLGAAARQVVIDHFSWEQCGQATISAYRKVLA